MRSVCSGDLSPSAGTARVDGHDILRGAAGVRNAIGYVPQIISVDGTLTAYENLVLMARLYDVPRGCWRCWLSWTSRNTGIRWFALSPAAWCARWRWGRRCCTGNKMQETGNLRDIRRARRTERRLG